MLWGTPTHSLRLYARHYKLHMTCRQPGCEHQREILYDHLVRLLGPTAPDMTLEQIAARFRCDKCGLRGGRIKTEYVGPTTDGR
jgi:hypothetical protein